MENDEYRLKAAERRTGPTTPRTTKTVPLGCALFQAGSA
jgi:hypothetical protein